MLNKVLGRVRMTLKALMLDSMRQGKRSRGRRNAARAKTNLSSIFGGFSTAVGNQRRSQLRRTAACESLEFRVLLTTWNIGSEALFPGSVDQFTTIYPTNYDGTPANIQIFWGGDHSGFSDSYYYFDANGGTGAFSQDLGTNPFIKFVGSTGDDIVRNLTGDLTGVAVKLTAYGYGGNDEFYGGQEYDKLIGGPGTDKLFGMGGDDVLYGGVASDNDELTGGTGEDRFYVRSTDVNLQLGVPTVVDKHKLDSRVHLVDTTQNTIEFGATFFPNTWSDVDFEAMDVVLNNMHKTTNSARLAQSATGGDIYQYRLGNQSVPTAAGAWSDGTDKAWYPVNALDPTTIAHEILHNWDEPDESPFGEAFRGLTGWTSTQPASFIEFSAWTKSNYDGYVRAKGGGNWWFHTSNLPETELFSREYGAHAPDEDFSTTGEAWYATEFLPGDFGFDMITLKQNNLKQLFSHLATPTTPSDLTIDQSLNINRPTFNWESLVADSFHVQIKDASNNVVVDVTTAELTLRLTADLPAGKYTFLVSSMTITPATPAESLMASINFTVNHAPEWVAGTPAAALIGINEDNSTSSGTTIASLTTGMTDVDAGAKKGIAIHYTSGVESGSWQATTNGGSSWFTFASIGFARERSVAFLMPANGNLSRVRFVPNKDFNGTVQLGYYAWDQTQGTAYDNFDISSANKRGGITAFSTGTHVSTLTVSPVNDAPVWAAGPAAALIGINEDNFISSGTNISSLTSGMTDVDAGAKKGIAVFYTTGLEFGSWQFTTNGGVEWNTFASPGFPRGRNNALLLPANANLSRVRFVPNKDYTGTVQLGYYAWDQTQGTAGGNLDLSTANKLGGVTAFSTGSHVSTLTVGPVNDAPEWVAGTPAAAMIGINEDNFISSGTNISSLTSGMTDVDAGAKKGIAVFYTTGLESGSWQFTTNGGVEWNTFASVGFPRGRNNALLLPANANLSRVRFVPNKDYNGNVQLGYYAWDQTQGTPGGNLDLSTANKLGGVTAFSTGTHVSTLTVSPVNDAPVWVGSTVPALVPINENDFNSQGTTIASLTAGVNDVDAGAKKGIAIFRASLPVGAGRWQYTLNGGNTWAQFASPSSPFGRDNALLLPANGNLSRVRFVPFKDFNGSVQLGYYAWDQTQGTAGGRVDISTDNKLGGMTAFSEGSHFSTLNVKIGPRNHAPEWVNGTPPALTPINENDFNSQGTTIASITAGVRDVDADAKKGIAVFRASLPVGAGRWQFTLNGGKTWAQFASPSSPFGRDNALLLPANGNLSRVRFVPFKDFNGSVTLGYYAWDQTQGTPGGRFDISTDNKLGGMTAFSEGSHFSTLNVKIGPRNHAPEWVGSTVPALVPINENDFNSQGTTIASLTAGVNDVDAGAKKGIAVFRASLPVGAGRWQFTLNGGKTWAQFASPSSPFGRDNALLLPANGNLSRVRFVPFKDFNGSVTLGYYAWDQTQGTPGGRFDISTDNKLGGMTAFSAGSHFSTLNVRPV